ncbi:MAG: hydroxymethylpyrimidine/phosphomethylpyrimidine kinase [Acidimicrobiales bacterium]
MSSTPPPVLLSIGGADSGGCYGVLADLRVWTHLGAHGTCAFTVITAQNSRTISAAAPLDQDLVAAQIEAVLVDFPVVGVKTGMLGRVEVVEVVAALAAAGRLPNLVVDPVLVDRHSRPLFSEAVVRAYRDLLLPRAALVTPNRPEAALLGLLDGGPCPVLITGGRRAGSSGDRLRDPPTGERDRDRDVDVDVDVDGDVDSGMDSDMVDELIEGSARRALTHPRVATNNVAGSGDVLSAAITFGLGTQVPLVHAVGRAIDLVVAGLRAGAGHRLGEGPGPPDLRGGSLI